MAFEVFDCRKAIRTAIGTDWIIDGQLEECIKIITNTGNMWIPMYTEEEESITCPPLPYIRIDLLGIRAIPHDIGATSREHRALISLDIKFNQTDKINVDIIGKKIADAIVDKVRTYQCSTSGIYFMNIINEGRIAIENRCEETVLHWIMELEALYYDI